MGPQNSPVYGTTQIRYGVAPSVGWLPMGRPPKAAQPTTPGGMILRENVYYLAPRVFRKARNETEWKQELARRSGVGAETIRRIVRGEGSPRLDNVEALASALGVSLIRLLDASLQAHGGTPVVERDADSGELQRSRRHSAP